MAQRWRRYQWFQHQVFRGDAEEGVVVSFPVSEAPGDVHGDGSVSSKLRSWWWLGEEKKEQREERWRRWEGYRERAARVAGALGIGGRARTAAHPSDSGGMDGGCSVRTEHDGRCEEEGAGLQKGTESESNKKN